MKNKKATGIKWDILLFALFASIAIIMILEFTETPIPSVGEYPAAMIKELEKNSITPEIIKRILEKINEVSVDDLREIEESLKELSEGDSLGNFDSYCENPSYKTKIRWRRFIMDNRGEDVWVHCLVNEYNLKWDFSGVFLADYKIFKPPLLYNLDVERDARYYIYNFEKDDNGAYFDIVRPIVTSLGDYRLRIPITTGSGKEIGGFSMDHSFKFPVNDSNSVAYDFYRFNEDNEDNEIMCIFSVGCTTCKEVMDRYPDTYKIMKVACSEYSDCEQVEDAIKEVFKCPGGELCQGTCTPYCSSSTFTEDTDSETNCRTLACEDYPKCSIADETIGCYCPVTQNKCVNTCLPYCSDAPDGKIEDIYTTTNCKENPCDSYDPRCATASACTCLSENPCSGACVPYCSDAPIGKIEDGDTLTNCQPYNCGNNIYVHDPIETCVSTSACYCEMSSRCYGTCDLCEYGDWVDAGGGCGEGSCSDTQILQEKVLTNGCPTQTQCDDRESLCKPYCSNPPEGEIDDGVDETKCRIGDCYDDYEDCAPITDNSCVCESGNPCIGDCTILTT